MIAPLPKNRITESLPGELQWKAQSWSPTWFYNFAQPINTVFCAIPKNGCKTLKRFMLAASRFPLETLAHPSEVHPVAAEQYSLSNLSREARLEALQASYRTVFLRDPVTRLVSGFADKVVRRPGRPENAAMYEEISSAESLAAPLDGTRGITFREFVHYTLRVPSDELDTHWKPQTCFTLDRDFDFVGRVERMADDLTKLADLLGVATDKIKRHEQSALAAWNGPPLTDVPAADLNAQGILPSRNALVTPDLEEAIRWRYQEDDALLAHLAPLSAESAA
ncbi:MAG: sulfotransferase family protein [Planctomycetota bacterium]